MVHLKGWMSYVQLFSTHTVSFEHDKSSFEILLVLFLWSVIWVNWSSIPQFTSQCFTLLIYLLKFLDGLSSVDIWIELR